MSTPAKGFDVRAILYTALAMLAFAANSLLCRLALAHHLIDPAAFATIRVLAGAVTLGLIVLMTGRRFHLSSVGLAAPAALVAYMVFFSFAYMTLSAGTGALLLFGAVQVTMIGVAVRSGERFALAAWSGLFLAIAGLAYLMAPGLSAPDPLGAALMLVAGVAWGVYSLLGKGATDPLLASAGNFLYAAAPALAFCILFFGHMSATPYGLMWALASGAITSGCGYVIWYMALSRLTAARASVVQLSVPAIAAFGGVLFLSERLTVRLLIASTMIIVGIAIVLTQRAAKSRGASA